jgi:putative oxidoreductase
MTSQSEAGDLRWAPLGGLTLRLSLGVVYLAHALSKPLLFTMPGTVRFFEDHGFPGWSAYPVFVLELVGGLLLVLGVRTRWVATALIPVTVGAVLVHAPNGWLFASPGGGWEYPAFLIAALTALALVGDGARRIPRPPPSSQEAAMKAGGFLRPIFRQPQTFVD